MDQEQIPTREPIQPEGEYGNWKEVEKGFERMQTREVARKIRSIEHFMFLWGTKGGHYLPPKKSITWVFIRQILTGKKRLLLSRDIGEVIDLPKVRGIIIRDLWNTLSERNSFSSFFPDITKGRTIPRRYFFNVR